MARAMAENPVAANGNGAGERFAPLTEADLAQQTDSGSFSRGQSYYRNRSIYDTIRRGATLRAQCHGSSGGPYTVEAILAPAGATAAENPVAIGCTCPRGGFCKHVVALLLTWIHAPERFAERPEIADLLAEKSREELVALIELMLRRAPELETLVELPLPAPRASDVKPAPGAGRKLTVETSAIRRQAASAFGAADDYGRGYGWGAETGIAAELAGLKAIGDRFADAGEWTNAQAVYRVVAEEAIAHYEETHDEGDISAVIVECAAGLVRCLDVQTELPKTDRLEPAVRREMLQVLYDLWQFGADFIDYDEPADPALAIVRHATDEERQAIESRLRASIKPVSDTGDYGVKYHNRAAVWFIVQLKEKAGIGDEELLEEYRGAELWDEAAATLLALGRIDEAIALAGRKLTQPMSLTAFADQLIALGGEGVGRALALVDGRLWESEGAQPHEDAALLEWLGQRYAAHGMPDKALAVERRRFKLRPDLATYEAVKAAAALPGQPPDVWPDLRDELIRTMREQGSWTWLIEVYLSEGEVGQALATLAEMDRQPRTQGHAWGYWSGANLRERVARAAEEEFPDEAIRLYKDLATRQIEHRQRTAYQQAAGYLARVMTLMERQGQAAEWKAYVTTLREENKRLRALREELNALGIE